MGALSALLGCDMIHTCCCLAVAVRMREVLGSFIFYFLYRPVFERCFAFFSCFFVSSGEGARAPKSFFRKTPCGIIVVNAPGRLYLKNLAAPGAFTRIIIITVYVWCLE